MVYEELFDEDVGYRVKKPLVNGNKSYLEHVTFKQLVEPDLDGLEGDLHLYLRLKEHLKHVRDDKNQYRDDDWINLEVLAGYCLEKMTLQRAMNLLKRRSDDPLKEDWDGISLEDYVRRLEE